MLVHFSCERMDDNVASFITSGSLSRWFCRRFIGAFNLPMFDFHLANSDYTASELFEALSPDKRPHRSATFVNLCWHISPPKIALKDRIFVNQCGVDNLTFSPRHKDPAFREKLIAELGVPTDSRLLLYAGRISPEKNISLLIDLVTELGCERENKYHLIVAGDGTGLDDLRGRMPACAGSQITFLGHLGDKLELARLYANADVFVHTNRDEPFGIAPLEALASGLALVAPNAGGVLSYANDENAWLAQATTPSRLRPLLSDVFSDRAVACEKIDAWCPNSGRLYMERVNRRSLRDL